MAAQSGLKAKYLERYRKDIVPAMMREFSYRNIMEVPKIEKIVINMGIKEGQEDVKILDQCQIELSRISGQKPVVTRAKKSISAFKLREGSPIGLKVTLRRNRMYEFMDRLINVAMPRIRDFRGYSEKSFDGQGNFTFGIVEQIIFPEVEYDKIKKTQGMDVTLVTTAKTDKEGRKLLEFFGFPFRKQ